MSKYLSMSGTFSKDTVMWGFPNSLSTVSSGPDKDGKYRTVMTNGKSYIDWVSGLGAVLIGNGEPEYVKHIQRAIAKGAGMSITHYKEHEVAEQLVTIFDHHVPGWTRDDISVRFAKAGSDAASMAVRIARAVTGRSKILSFGYHGWHSEFIAGEEPAHGIPREYKSNIIHFDFNEDLDSIEKKLIENDIAAIILEHPPFLPSPGWYYGLRGLCDKYGALLIIDEVVTGLRYGLGGACEKWTIFPDMVCLGKSLGNGMPIAALVGFRNYMDWFSRADPVFCSSTHWGEPVSLAAAEYVLSHWDELHIKYITVLGEHLMKGLSEAGWDVWGDAQRSLFRYKTKQERAFFIHGMFEHGVLMNRPNFPVFLHDLSDVEYTIEAAKEVRARFENATQEELNSLVLPRVLFENR